jgi:hypothetical protein
MRRCDQEIVIDAAARGAMGTIDSYIAVASQTEFKPHTKPRSIRARPSAERRVGRALTAFNNESGQQPIADPMCAMKAAKIRDFLRRIASAKCIMIN